ncbi:Prolyl 4-hydroxylase subunit alpha-2 [Hypsibius exemplaris]|uniref:procollagen-proline 4-dioxygenase n=1 Tax=Hypsibius exemplaris TaxID=2072580 RepID=A0A9X6RKM0_HYPEX|nr:Prolyl 4-hydroxylase subunit alpha-2 [Hypsibius exemplaris]
MDDLESLVVTEQEVLKILRDLRNRENLKLDAAREYAQQLRHNSEPGTDESKRAENIFRHPINAFHFITHHTKTWEALREGLRDPATRDSLAKIQDLKNSTKFPDDEDRIGTAHAFWRLQATYKFHPKDVFNGRIPNTRPTPPFTAREAFIVGQKQAQDSNFLSALQYLETAVERYHEENVLRPWHGGRLVELLDWLQFAVWHSSRNASRALEISLMIQQLQPTMENLEHNIKTYTDYRANLTEEQRAEVDLPPKEYKETAEDGHYERLCRGELNVAPRVHKHQRCYLEDYKNPVLLLQPIKTEVAHVDPDVFVLHDVFLDSEIKRIRAVSSGVLKRANVISKGTTGQVTSSRISKTAFLADSRDPSIASASSRSGLVSNLDPKNAEPLQVNNYGIGGMYHSHFDFFNDPDGHGLHLIKPDQGDRMATFMVYMTDVEVGGATVFPRINLTIYPEKGSVAFWFNLYRDGVPDIRTLHSGCPVLAGSKWVANKWYHEVEQDKTRLCGLQPDSPQEEVVLL